MPTRSGFNLNRGPSAPSTRASTRGIVPSTGPLPSATRRAPRPAILPGTGPRPQINAGTESTNPTNLQQPRTTTPRGIRVNRNDNDISSSTVGSMGDLMGGNNPTEPARNHNPANAAQFALLFPDFDQRWDERIQNMYAGHNRRVRNRGGGGSHDGFDETVFDPPPRRQRRTGRGGGRPGDDGGGSPPPPPRRRGGNLPDRRRGRGRIGRQQRPERPCGNRPDGTKTHFECLKKGYGAGLNAARGGRAGGRRRQK